MRKQATFLLGTPDAPRRTRRRRIANSRARPPALPPPGACGGTTRDAWRHAAATSNRRDELGGVALLHNLCVADAARRDVDDLGGLGLRQLVPFLGEVGSGTRRHIGNSGGDHRVLRLVQVPAVQARRDDGVERLSRGGCCPEMPTGAATLT